jgi:cytochrome c553
MQRWARIMLGAAGAAALAAVAAGVALLWAGNHQLATDFGALPESVASGPGDAALGARLVSVYGCDGCHGKALTGNDFYGIIAPNLRHRARLWGVEGFARAVRRGIRPDGTSTSWAMPTEHFSTMADSEIAAIHAHLVKQGDAPDDASPTIHHRLFKAYAAATGELVPNAVVVRPTDRGPAMAPAPGSPDWGRYFTRLACAECHGHDLRGNPGFAPALADVIQVYDWPAFVRLTTTGRPPDGRELRLMTSVGRERLAHMSDAERRALFEYLKALPA